MSGNWPVRAAQAGDLAQWSALRAALWPDVDAAEHRADIEDQLAQPERFNSFLALDGIGMPIGLAEASLRCDYVNGTESSPVGFLDGLYVVPAVRRRGVGRALVAAVEAWTRALGCRELASDSLLANEPAHAAHRAYGFEETERVVYFRKSVDR
ncbi:aminoglycoside 6'-N-acetyltransferase [Dokdonella soli]|uniref:Aminoglycoside N(6')-acetyltransferase type 1 n=1 Tax=Dokdonella soli TaxID=529810 RepID=A0ABN1ICZ0_9GAMM